MDIRRIYEYALAREYEGKRFFEQNAERLSHAAAIGAFKQLAAEEQKQIEFIQSQIAAIDKGMENLSTFNVELDQESFFSQRAITEGIDQTVSESMVPDLPILRMAYLIERDFAEFYEMAAAKVDGQARQVLQMLAHWERGHERLFKQFHDKAFEIYAQMPWGG